MRKAQIPIPDPPELPEGYFFRVKVKSRLVPMVTVEIRRGKPDSWFTLSVLENTVFLKHDSDVPKLVSGLAWISAEDLQKALGVDTKVFEALPYEGDHGA